VEKKLTIAIDGYSSCGKSTFAKSIAKMLNYIYIDSGAMYRAVTLYCMRNKLIVNDAINHNGILAGLKTLIIEFVFNPSLMGYETYLNSENVEDEIRSLDVAAHVSRISMIPEVRERMVELQQKMGAEKGIVMDGRDIGTVVFPDADIKIFMTASADIRARRRLDELTGKNIVTNFEEVRKNIVARDIADENRDISPLRRAEDAVILDNSRMTVDEQMVWFRQLIEKKQNES
jgi:cytidylate kinase